MFMLLVGNPLKSNVLEENTSLIELNHQYNLDGTPLFDQIIFWEKLPETGKYRIRAWTMADYDKKEKRFALNINDSDHIYTVTYFDTDERVNRKIISRLFRESFTQKDPEREDKLLYDERTRVGLRKKNPIPDPPYTIVDPL